MPSPIYTLPLTGHSGKPAESMRVQIGRGLRGTDSPTIPGTTDEDKKWAYKRSIPPIALYDQEGLRLYDDLTSYGKEYYLFEDELNLLKDHGAEIAAAMGFPHADVGRWNKSVNGEEGLAAGITHGWDVVELGAGALRKTAHMLTALADSVPDLETPPITFYALDLSLPELDRVLGEMEEGYGSVLNGRVACVGLHGDYNAGIKVVQTGTLSSFTSGAVTPSLNASASESGSPGSPTSAHLVTPAMKATDLSTIPNEDELKDLMANLELKDAPAVVEGERPLHFLFFGSTLGNFEREAAMSFLKQLPLRPGDTLLLGLDGRPVPGPEGCNKVELAYNDPKGYNNAFAWNAWDVVRAELGLVPDHYGIEVTGRYNEIMGRYERFFRSKKAQVIPLSGDSVELDKDELLHVAWSFKYSVSEAMDMFDKADLHLIKSWKAPESGYRLWLLERPVVGFSPTQERLASSQPTMGE
ncbi:hypothetical protein CspHIS471_0404790 [Cutaneotrichosporon sp. HIS471]|nr:hypothetical protein CspHIS471_0404790 [Cutaneotrichosporon sp. HIS471]